MPTSSGQVREPDCASETSHDEGLVIEGYELIPEDFKLIHVEYFRDDVHYNARLANLIRQLSEAIPPVGKRICLARFRHPNPEFSGIFSRIRSQRVTESRSYAS